jgi:GNAT superfamily N-acetyltransferase
MKSFEEYVAEGAVLKLSKSSFAATTDEYVKKVYSMGRRSGSGIKLKGAQVDLTPFAGTVVINEISLPYSRQGKGAGHKIMKILTDLADEMGVRLQLFASPIDQGPGVEKISKSKLVDFYKKHGFKGASRMIREPK